MAELTQATKERVLSELEKILNKTSDKNVADLVKWIYEDLNQ